MKKYWELEIEVIVLSTQDVLTGSSDQDFTSDPFDPNNPWGN